MKLIKKPFVRRLFLFSFITLFVFITVGFSSLNTKAYTTDITTYPLNGSSVRLHVPIKQDTSFTITIEYDNASYRLAYIDNANLYVYDWTLNSYTFVAYLNNFYMVFDLDYDLSVENGMNYYDCSYSFVCYNQVDPNYLVLNENFFGVSETLLLGIEDNSPLLVIGGSLNFPNEIIGTFLIEQNSSLDNSSYLDIATSSISFIKDNFNKFLVSEFDRGYASGYNEGVLNGGSNSVPNFGTVLLNSVNSFLSIEVLPNFSLLNILHLCLALGFVFVILRFFAGG